jgi:hypothetical protein
MSAVSGSSLSLAALSMAGVDSSGAEKAICIRRFARIQSMAVLRTMVNSQDLPLPPP